MKQTDYDRQIKYLRALEIVNNLHNVINGIVSGEKCAQNQAEKIRWIDEKEPFENASKCTNTDLIYKT